MLRNIRVPRGPLGCDAIFVIVVTTVVMVGRVVVVVRHGGVAGRLVGWLLHSVFVSIIVRLLEHVEAFHGTMV